MWSALPFKMKYRDEIMFGDLLRILNHQHAVALLQKTPGTSIAVQECRGTREVLMTSSILGGMNAWV